VWGEHLPQNNNKVPSRRLSEVLGKPAGFVYFDLTIQAALMYNRQCDTGSPISSLHRINISRKLTPLQTTLNAVTVNVKNSQSLCWLGALNLTCNT